MSSFTVLDRNGDVIYTAGEDAAPSLCDETCRECFYSTVMSLWGVCCNYILVTGQRRGCPAGAGCKHHKVGTKPLALDMQLFLGRTEPIKSLPKPAAEPKREEQEKPQETEKERRKRLNHEYYLKHKAKLDEKSIEAYERRKREGKENPKSWAEKRRITAVNTMSVCQGRQREAIETYLRETGLSCSQLAKLVGVTDSTMRKWRREGNHADWTKLTPLGIKRPEGL